MLTTSAAFKTAIASEDREIRAYLKFNGSTILRGVDGLVSIEWDQSVYDEERLCIGCAVSSFITAEFFDNLTGVDFKNSYVEAFVGVVLEDTGTAPSGSIEPDTATVEYVSLGRFDITDSVTKNGKTVITAYDKLSKLSGEYTPSISAGANGYAIADIVNDVLTQSGVGGSVSGSYGYVQKIQASTYREQLKYCLTMMVQNGSSYILDRTNDTLKMTSVIGQDATQLTITDSTTYIDGMDEQPSFTISSLQATTGTDVYTFGNGQGIEISNPYITNAQASAIYNRMEGFSYLPIRLEFRGNPAIDPGDVLTLTAGGKNTKIVAMRIRSTFNGGFKSTIDCYGNTETYYAMSESPTGTRITQAENMIRLEAARATAAEGSLSSLIDINAEGISLVSEKLNNIGGRNYAWAMDPSIHARAYLQNCTLTYNPDNNGEYRIVGESGTNNQQAWYYGSGETGYAIPSELIGEKVIFHADYISATGASATPRAYMVFYDSSDTNVGEYYLEPGDLSKTFTVPTTAIRMTPLLRVRQSGTFQSVEVLTVRGLKLEKGEVATDWTPAPEDDAASIASNKAAIYVNSTAISLKVSQTDYNGNTIASLINQTSTSVQIQASKVDLQGYVTFTNLSTAGQTAINGANITTGTLNANAIAANSTFTQNLTATNFNITGGSISITTDSARSDVINLSYQNFNSYMSPYGVSGQDGTGSFSLSSTGRLTLKDPDGGGALYVYDKTQSKTAVTANAGNTSCGIQVGSYDNSVRGYLQYSSTATNKISLVFEDGRMWFDKSALEFRNSSGYATARYTAEGDIQALSSGTLRMSLYSDEGLTFFNSSGNVTASYPATPTTMSYNTTVSPVTSRGSISSGGAYAWGSLIFVSLVFSASANASNSPQIATLPAALNDTALSAIDITSGIGSSIDSAVPCGIAENGKLYIKTITSGHIYAISGVYPHG